MNIRTATAALWLVLAATSAQAFSGELLRRGCRAPLRPDSAAADVYWSGYCRGTVDAVVHTLRNTSAIERANRIRVCLPGDEHVKTIVDPISEATKAAVDASLLDLDQNGQKYIADYLDKFPELLSWPARAVALQAFKARFPCPNR